MKGTFAGALLLLCCLVLNQEAASFVLNPKTAFTTTASARSFVVAPPRTIHQAAAKDDNDKKHVKPRNDNDVNSNKDYTPEEEESPPPPMITTSTVRIDDGGSDLTERFKYKVNALMGAFDPADPTQDTENENGNILNALVRFPILYTFTVVGKTLGDADLQNQFVADVKRVVLKETRESEENMTLLITPRGTKFTKVALSVEVQSAQVIAAIYQGLEATPGSVMQF